MLSWFNSCCGFFRLRSMCSLDIWVEIVSASIAISSICIDLFCSTVICTKNILLHQQWFNGFSLADSQCQQCDGVRPLHGLEDLVWWGRNKVVMSWAKHVDISVIFRVYPVLNSINSFTIRFKLYLTFHTSSSCSETPADLGSSPFQQVPSSWSMTTVHKWLRSLRFRV